MTLVTYRARALALTSVVLLGFFAACNSKHEKVESARENLQEEKQDVAEARQEGQQEVTEQQRDVQEAAQELNEAQQQARAEWKTDYLGFKREMVNEIADNERLILEKRQDAVNAAHQDTYNSALAEAERHNNELRDRLNNVTDQGDEVWTKFKDDFRTEVNNVEEAIKKIDVKG